MNTLRRLFSRTGNVTSDLELPDMDIDIVVDVIKVKV